MDRGAELRPKANEPNKRLSLPGSDGALRGCRTVASFAWLRGDTEFGNAFHWPDDARWKTYARRRYLDHWTRQRITQEQ